MGLERIADSKLPGFQFEHEFAGVRLRSEDGGVKSRLVLSEALGFGRGPSPDSVVRHNLRA